MVYDSVIDEMRSWFNGLWKQGGDQAIISKYGKILGGLTRLKQICCDYRLVPVQHLARLMSDELGEGARNSLLSKLEQIFQQGGGHKAAYEDGEDIMCLVCFDPLLRQNAKITKCGHLFCSKCLEEIFLDKQLQNHKCPMCREPLKAKECVRPSSHPALVAADGGAATATAQDDQLKFSSKGLLLLHRVRELLTSPAADQVGKKCVVISQFTTFLDRLQKQFAKERINVCRVDGRMDINARSAQIRRFSDTSSSAPNVMLLSLRAGGVAIDLTAANHVFLMDQWWNPAIDTQAIDRVHRLGQKRDVQVWKFIVKDSIEEKIVEMQEIKQALTAGIHSRLSPAQFRRTRVKALFNIFTRRNDNADQNTVD